MANTMENVSGSYRDLIIAVGGRITPGETLRRYWSTVADRSGLRPRVVMAAWHGEYASRETLKKLREAAEHARTNEAVELAARLEALALGLRDHAASDEILDRAACDLDRAAGTLRRLAGS